MTLLPSAFFWAVPLALLTALLVETLRTQSTQKVVSTVAFCGPEGSDWQRNTSAIC